MALLRQAYSALFRRTSTFALTVVLGAVLFERAFDQGADAIFEHLNEGVRKDRGAAGAVGGGSGPEGQRGVGGARRLRGAEGRCDLTAGPSGCRAPFPPWPGHLSAREA